MAIRLKAIYNDIIRSELITNNIISIESMNELKNLLDKSLPLNIEEKIAKRTLLTVAGRNTHHYINFIQRTNQDYLVLWCRPSEIVKHLGLRNIVFIDMENNQYTVNPHSNLFD